MDKFLTHEALDRTNICVEAIESLIYNHPYFEENKELQYKIGSALVLLSEVYQAVGAEHFNTINN